MPQSHTMDEQFFIQLRDKTEEKWRAYQPLTFEEFLAQDKISYIWQPNTKWLGLSDPALEALEQRWSLRFPPDYRLFLKILHCLDKPITIATYDGDTREIIPADSSLFHNWQTDTHLLTNAYQQIIDDLRYEVVHNNVWKPGWGRKPVSKYGQSQQIGVLISQAPKLIPIYDHRFLLSEPYQAGNPVISIRQSEIVIYAPDFYSFLCKDFSDLLDLDKEALKQIDAEAKQMSKERYSSYKSIPFWGELI
jgi:hypothetical protein